MCSFDFHGFGFSIDLHSFHWFANISQNDFLDLKSILILNLKILAVIVVVFN